MQCLEGGCDPKRTNLSPCTIHFILLPSSAPLSKWPSTPSILGLNDVMTWLSSYLYLIKLERLLNIIWPLAYSKRILIFAVFFLHLLSLLHSLRSLITVLILSFYFYFFPLLKQTLSDLWWHQVAWPNRIL